MGLEMITFNVSDGTLYCKLRRDIKTTVKNREFDLINDEYYLLVAAGTKLKGNYYRILSLALLRAIILSCLILASSHLHMSP